MNNSINTRKIVLSGLFIALGLALPFLTGQIPSVGSKLLPMHLPVLIGGFVLGAPFAALVGIVTPVLRSVIFGMPPLYPVAIAMAFELATYGGVSGLLYGKLKESSFGIWISLIVAMLAGRIVWGAAMYTLLGLKGNAFTLAMFMSGAFVNAIPGIVVQLLIIPVIVSMLKKAGHI